MLAHKIERKWNFSFVFDKYMLGIFFKHFFLQIEYENYTFYNPRLHADFTPPDSPILLFEGTYTAEFADRPPRTPRHNYTQILYRLDLDDPALVPARPAAP